MGWVSKHTHPWPPSVRVRLRPILKHISHQLYNEERSVMKEQILAKRVGGYLGQIRVKVK